MVLNVMCPQLFHVHLLDVNKRAEYFFLSMVQRLHSNEFEFCVQYSGIANNIKNNYRYMSAYNKRTNLPTKEILLTTLQTINLLTIAANKSTLT